VSVRWAHGWAAQKRPNRSRCRFGSWHMCVQETIMRGVQIPQGKGPPRGVTRLDGDAAFYQIALDICLVFSWVGFGPWRDRRASSECNCFAATGKWLLTISNVLCSMVAEDNKWSQNCDERPHRRGTCHFAKFHTDR